MSAKADRRLQAALRDLSAALDETGAPWMIIGGIAVIARGVRRFTGDIDAAIRGDEIQIGRLLAALAKKRIVPRIADAERFAAENLVVLLRHEQSGVDFDVSLAWTAFEHEAIAGATVAMFGTVKAPMARPEDLIVFKAVAGRGKDIDDAVALLALYPKLDVAHIRARVRELAVMADVLEMVDGLERAIMAAKKAAPPSKSHAARKAKRVRKSSGAVSKHRPSSRKRSKKPAAQSPRR